MTITLKVENTDIEEQLKAFIQEQKEVTIEQNIIRNPLP